MTADTLLRAPVSLPQHHSLQEEVNLYIDSILAQLPASDVRLREVRQRQEEDEVCQKLAEHIKRRMAG